MADLTKELNKWAWDSEGLKKQEESSKELLRLVRHSKLKGKLEGDYKIGEIIERLIIFSLILGRRISDMKAVSLSSLSADLVESQERKARTPIELNLSESIKDDLSYKHNQLINVLCGEFSSSNFEFNDYYKKFLFQYSIYKKEKLFEINKAIELINTFRVIHRLIERKSTALR